MAQHTTSWIQEILHFQYDTLLCMVLMLKYFMKLKSLWSTMLHTVFALVETFQYQPKQYTTEYSIENE